MKGDTPKLQRSMSKITSESNAKGKRHRQRHKNNKKMKKKPDKHKNDDDPEHIRNISNNHSHSVSRNEGSWENVV